MVILSPPKCQPWGFWRRDHWIICSWVEHSEWYFSAGGNALVDCSQSWSGSHRGTLGNRSWWSRQFSWLLRKIWQAAQTLAVPLSYFPWGTGKGEQWAPWTWTTSGNSHCSAIIREPRAVLVQHRLFCFLRLSHYLEATSVGWELCLRIQAWKSCERSALTRQRRKQGISLDLS